MLMLGLLLSTVLLGTTDAAAEGTQCGPLLLGKGFRANMPGKPTKFASTAQDCCAFCHATAGCKFWTWNGLPPGNGMCYAKASSKIGESHPGMVSGGVAPGPPLPPPPPVHVTLDSAKAISTTGALMISQIQAN